MHAFPACKAACCRYQITSLCKYVPPNPGGIQSFFLLQLAGPDLSLTNPDRRTTDADGCDECEVPTRTHGAAASGREHRQETWAGHSLLLC